MRLFSRFLFERGGRGLINFETAFERGKMRPSLRRLNRGWFHCVARSSERWHEEICETNIPLRRGSGRDFFAMMSRVTFAGGFFFIFTTSTYLPTVRY